MSISSDHCQTIDLLLLFIFLTQNVDFFLQVAIIDSASFALSAVFVCAGVNLFVHFWDESFIKLERFVGERIVSLSLKQSSFLVHSQQNGYYVIDLKLARRQPRHDVPRCVAQYRWNGFGPRENLQHFKEDGAKRSPTSHLSGYLQNVKSCNFIQFLLVFNRFTL